MWNRRRGNAPFGGLFQQLELGPIVLTPTIGISRNKERCCLMENAGQELPKVQTGTGYRQLQTGGPAGTALGATLLYATIGVALGILAGTSLAASPWLSNVSFAPKTLGQVTASAAELKGAPAASANPSPKPVAPTRNQGVELLSSAVKTGATVPAVRAASVRRRLPGRLRAAINHKPHMPRKKLTIAAARVDYPVERYSFIIEGDVTVVNFDASEGMIETHEGKTFVISSAVAESNAILWQDYRSNVHYRCNQAGSCTLVRAGVIVPNARLSL